MADPLWITYAWERLFFGTASEPFGTDVRGAIITVGAV
jgi:hypothetical protein